MQPLELVLFETDATRAVAARAQGISRFIFDVEASGKAERQHLFDTDISIVTLHDLSAFVADSGIRPLCRLDALHADTAEEIDLAIANGAGELLFSMVRTTAEVERLLSLVAGRLPMGIMIETKEILGCVPEIAHMPVSRAYVGLNDLMISKGGRSLFEAMIDGTVDRIRREIGSVRFGVAGATRVDAGSPVPFRLLLAELARLEVDFTMLRRAFRRDVPVDSIGAAIGDIQTLWIELRARPPSAIAGDHARFTAMVVALDRQDNR